MREHFGTRINGELVYKFKKLIRRNDFSFECRKIIIRCKRIGYNLNVMRQPACLVYNQIMADNYVALGPGLLDCCLAHGGSTDVFFFSISCLAPRNPNRQLHM